MQNSSVSAFGKGREAPVSCGSPSCVLHRCFFPWRWWWWLCTPHCWFKTGGVCKHQQTQHQGWPAGFGAGPSQVLPRHLEEGWGNNIFDACGCLVLKSTAGQVESSCALASLLTSVKQVNTILKCPISTGFASQDHRVCDIPWNGTWRCLAWAFSSSWEPQKGFF